MAMCTSCAGCNVYEKYGRMEAVASSRCLEAGCSLRPERASVHAGTRARVGERERATVCMRCLLFQTGRAKRPAAHILEMESRLRGSLPLLVPARQHGK
eukprot:6175466-Pleurochrysis_carterae.AAC.4